jgi:hypothetical protein
MNFKKFTDIKKINESDDKLNIDLSKSNLPENIINQQSNINIDSSSEGTPMALFSKLFESREMAHIYHLKSKGDEGSYASHMALESFYENIIKYIDELIETYQGQYGIVDGYDIIDTKSTKTKDKIDYFEELATYIKNARKCISEEDTHLHNIIDEIVSLAYKTLYKLKFHK